MLHRDRFSFYKKSEPSPQIDLKDIFKEEPTHGSDGKHLVDKFLQ